MRNHISLKELKNQVSKAESRKERVVVWGDELCKTQFMKNPVKHTEE